MEYRAEGEKQGPRGARGEVQGGKGRQPEARRHDHSAWNCNTDNGLPKGAAADGKRARRNGFNVKFLSPLSRSRALVVCFAEIVIM